MKKHLLIGSVGTWILAFSAGCAFLSQSPLSDSPRYDQVLTYNRPYDYTYMKTLEALDTFPNWILEEMEKETGLIVLRNTQYSHLFDRDKEMARFRVRKVGRNRTSIALEPDSYHLREGGEFLNRIDLTMAAAAMAEQALARREQVTEAVP